MSETRSLLSEPARAPCASSDPVGQGVRQIMEQLGSLTRTIEAAAAEEGTVGNRYAEVLRRFRPVAERFAGDLLAGGSAAAEVTDVRYAALPVREEPLAEGRRFRTGGGRRGRYTRTGSTRTIPSFLERMQLLHASDLPRDDPRLPDLVPEPQLLAFVRTTGIGRDDARALLTGEESYVVAIRRGLLDTLLLRLANFRKRSAVAEEVWIPIAEIHCPHVQGCESVYEWGAEKKKAANLRVTAVGVGGGGGVSTEVAVTTEITAPAACRRVEVLAKVLLEEWRADPNGEILNVINVREFKEDTRFGAFGPDDPHYCTDDVEQARRWLLEAAELGHDVRKLEFPLPVNDGAHATIKRSLKVRRGTMLNATVDAVIHGIPISVELASEVIRSFGYSYTLAEPCHYLGFYTGPASSSYSWAWQQSV